MNQLELLPLQYITKNIDKFNYFKPALHLFDQQIYLPGANASTIINKFKDISFDFVLNGSEVSVEVATEVAQHFVPQYANDLNWRC